MANQKEIKRRIRTVEKTQQITSAMRMVSAAKLLRARPERKRLELLVIASDRGLCGAFNANVLKAAQAALAERGPQFEQVSVSTVGRKAAEFVRRRRPLEKS